MPRITIENMPLNTVYEFAPGYYIWKVERYSTIHGNYKESTPSVYTEVFSKVSNTSVWIEGSGNLLNDGRLNSDNRFHIFDYDMDTTISFKQTQELIPLENKKICEEIKKTAPNINKNTNKR